MYFDLFLVKIIKYVYVNVIIYTQANRLTTAHTCTSVTHIFCVDASHSRPVGQRPVTSLGRVAPKQNAKVLRLVQANT